jgi:hypothetical protein
MDEQSAAAEGGVSPCDFCAALHSIEDCKERKLYDLAIEGGELPPEE